MAADRVTRLRPENRVEVTTAPAREADATVIYLIAGFVLLLTISTLVLENPDARLAAAGLAALGLAIAVAMIAAGKLPKPAKHVVPNRPQPGRRRRLD